MNKDENTRLTTVVTTRLSDDEADALMKYANGRGVSRSSATRELVLMGLGVLEPRPVIPPYGIPADQE